MVPWPLLHPGFSSVPLLPLCLPAFGGSNAVTVPVDAWWSQRDSVRVCWHRGALRGLETKAQSEIQGTAELP